MFNFSKAFDLVDHPTLIQKLKALNIADNIIQWVMSFLTDCNQFVRMNEKWSFWRIINLSIVQCSCIVPTLSIICIMDLKPVGLRNCITKYADDANFGSGIE